MSHPDKTIADSRDSDAKTELDSSIGGHGGFGASLPPELAVGYTIVGTLGEGSQALVYRCRPADGSRDVAIKLYTTPRHRLEPDVIRKIEEADPAHILPSEFGVSGGKQWEIQEWMSGGTLAKLSKPGIPMEPGRVKDIVREAASAIAYAHSLGLVHRDTKPSNILVRRIRPMDLVLADFGIARELIAGTEIGTTAHTPGYASPEALVGELHSFTLDWWSLGITLFEVIAGRHPFVDDDDRRWSDVRIHSFLAAQDVDTSIIEDARVRLLIRGLLTYDRNDRWSYKQVQEWLDGKTPEVIERTVIPDSLPEDWRFVYLGEEHRSPERLGKAMLANWNQAVDYLKDRGNRVAMQNALDRTRYVDQVDVEFKRYQDNRLTLDGLVFQLGHLLSGSGPFTFRGVHLDNDGLGGKAREAGGGDAAAGTWINQLLDSRVLTLTNDDADYATFMEIDERLNALKTAQSRMIDRAVQAQATWFDAQVRTGREAPRADLPDIVNG